MPEGDSIFRLAARLRPALVGRAITAFTARRIDDAAAASLVGRVVVEVASRGKNLLVRFDDGRTLHVHLKMLGRVRMTPRALAASRAAYRASLGARPPRAPELRLENDRVVVTGSAIPIVRLLAPGAEARAEGLAGLGPDLLAPDFDAEEALRRLRARGRRPIGEVVMDQGAVAGIGNVYKSEVLFLQGLSPRARVADLDDDALRGILARARELLRKNVAQSVAQNMTGRPRTTRSSLRSERLWVYGRARAPCFVCGTPIERFHQGKDPPRSTYTCPRCQPPPA